MKRLFGNQSSSNNPPTQLNEGNTVTANGKRPTSPSETISLAGSTTTHTPTISATQRAPLYSRASHSFSSQALQTPALLSPHTPSASSVNPFELFPPSLALSPINSNSSRTATTNNLPSSTSYVGSGSMAAVQNIAPQFTGQTISNVGTMPTAQPGALPILADSNASLTNMQAHAIERNDLHKSVKVVESILVSLDEYRDLRTKLAKCEKKLSKGLNEMAKVKSIEEVPSQTLQAASDLFEARMEVSSKQAKIIQKEYDALNDQCAKYFKRIAKEERSHDEQLESLESKIKKTQASYDKSAKKGGKLAVESHDKFISSMQSLTADMAKLKSSHSSSVGTKTFSTSVLVAATLGGLADTEYKGVCEIVRRSGQHIGKLNEWLNFTVNEAMAKTQPFDLSDDGSGIAQRIAVKEAEICEEIRRQEQIRLRQLEDEHAMLKLQQLGWTPPSNLTNESPNKTNSSDIENKDKDSKPVTTMANLPRLDSNGNLVDTQKPKKPQEPSVAESASNNATAAGRASEEPRISPARSTTHEGHHLQSSSMAEGTVIIRDAEPEKKEEEETPTRMQTVKEESGSINENEADCPPSPNETSNGSSSLSSNMSASVSTVATSKGGSEDSNTLHTDSKSAGPLTPIDEKPDDVIVRGVDDKTETEWQKEDKEGNKLIKEQKDYISRVLSPSHAEESRGKDEHSMTGIGTRFSNQRTEENSFSAGTVKESNERRQEQASSRSSLWERERDRERQVDLERRLIEAENRLRMMDRPESFSSNRQHGYEQHQYYRDVPEPSRASTRPRHSEPMPKISSSTSRPTRLDEEIPASRYEPDRYAPAVGSSRIEGPSVTRSLSTDSERSFVARMKALYQADKMQQSPQDIRRRDDLAIPTSPRRVPEIVHAYSSNTSRNTTNPQGSNYGHYDSATAPSSKSRTRYDSAPTQIRSSGNGGDIYRTDEFGRKDYPNQTINSSRASRPAPTNEPPHASSCGCWNCSARHYRSNDSINGGASISMATTKAGILPPQPPPRHPEAVQQNRGENGYHSNAPPNYRRQTMQIPPNGNTNTVRSYSGSPNGLMKPEQSIQVRRSFEDEHSRHVKFTREHGTVR